MSRSQRAVVAGLLVVVSIAACSGDDETATTDSDAITVEPGERAEITHSFSADDDGLLIGCHQPGHYDAGMVTTIHVS